MESPVLQLQSLASEGTANVQDVILKAKMIAVKLGLTDITGWLENEINGYDEWNSVPDYRVITSAPIKAFNPYHGWIHFDISNIEDMEIYHTLTTAHIMEGVAGLREYSQSKGPLYMTLPQPIASFLNKVSNVEGLQLAWLVNPTVMTRITSTVKSKILDWSLDLEAKGIMGEGLRFTQKEKENAHMTVTNNNTNNFHAPVNNAGAIGAGNAGDINQQNSITAGDISSLERELKCHGLDDNDVAELKQLVEHSPKPVSKEEVEKGFGSWIGKMTGKAFTGALKVAGAAAPAVLTNALCFYYGIPV